MAKEVEIKKVQCNINLSNVKGSLTFWDPSLTSTGQALLAHEISINYLMFYLNTLLEYVTNKLLFKAKIFF